MPTCPFRDAHARVVQCVLTSIDDSFIDYRRNTQWPLLLPFYIWIKTILEDRHAATRSHRRPSSMFAFNGSRTHCQFPQAYRSSAPLPSQAIPSKVVHASCTCHAHPFPSSRIFDVTFLDGENVFLDFTVFGEFEQQHVFY
jgi:hypothetical protein